ncbi:MAG: TetR/AcrR family transcriptional regulator [Bacilli bacterium]|nr:TetR/AcrR family transcriptional regulator [Bacilli bacterium]
MRQNERNVSNEKDTYVSEKITDTLLKLLKGYTLKEISISFLCDEAGVGRASFYRNFESKEDVLIKYDTKLIKQWGKEYENDKNSTPESLIPSLLIHYKRYKDFYLMMYRNGLSDIVLKTILKACELEKKKTNMEAYVTSFIGYGIFGIVNEWIKRGMQETIEEILSLISQNKGI